MTNTPTCLHIWVSVRELLFTSASDMEQVKKSCEKKTDLSRKAVYFVLNVFMFEGYTSALSLSPHKRAPQQTPIKPQQDRKGLSDTPAGPPPPYPHVQTTMNTKKGESI